MAQYDNSQVYDRIYGLKNYALEARLIHQLIQRHNPRARSLLDVACGTGRHLEHLKTHYRCEGLDLSPELLEGAQRRNPDLRFHQGDMSRFSLGGRFDAITCLFSAVGYLDGVEPLERALACFAEHLNPGGVVLLEPWLFPETFEAGHTGLQTVDEPGLKLVRMNTSRAEGRVSVLEFHYLHAEGGKVRHWLEEHRLFLFTRGEYLQALARAGLRAELDDQGISGRGLFVGVGGGPAGRLSARTTRR